MDIVSGLPETSDGYIKILVIVEYMSKMIRIYPLKKKTQLEISEKLWLYISQFGPPKIILSDQGTEFVNKTVEGLLAITGIERRVTSAYNPRTDGLCERANQTIISMLRKHAESDQLNWDKWLPYLEYSYNTRIHSTTKFSPYEILYGIKANEFYNYYENKQENEPENLYKRSIEIKNLVEKTRT